jgi:hypothetical protein
MKSENVEQGKLVNTFADELSRNRNCQAYRLGNNANIFHLTSRAVYRSIGHENLRHRRSHKIDYVKTKLLGLDFFLRDPGYKYFPTEGEKLELFTELLEVPLADLPAKSYQTPHSKQETLRYFVDKFPIFLTGDPRTRPVVHVSYVDPGPYISSVDFLNFLRLYSRLFICLGEVRLLYIHHRSKKLKQAEALFHDFARSGWEVAEDDPDLDKYFQLRQAWEAEQYEKVGPTELLFLNKARKRYAGAQHDRLYLEWKSRVPKSANVPPIGGNGMAAWRFMPYEVGKPYSVFGNLD